MPPLSARVIDQTGTLTAAQIDALDGQAAALETETGPQIVILMVPTHRSPRTSPPMPSASATRGRSAAATSATAC